MKIKPRTALAWLPPGYPGLVLAVLAWSLAAAWAVDPHSIIQPDSQGFSEFSPLRTSLYPLILRAVAWGTGSALTTVYVQIAVAGLAVLFLAGSVQRWSGRWAYAFAVLPAVLANPYAAALHGQIMSDSFFVSTLCLYLGVLLRLDRGPRPGLFAALSLLTGIGIALRPASYALVPLWAFIFWFYPVWRPRCVPALALILATLPGTLVVTADRLYHRSVHGPGAPSLLDLHSFARAVTMDGAWPGDGVTPELTEAITGFRAQTRRGSAAITDLFPRRYYLQVREVEAEYRFPSGPLFAAASARGLPVHDYQRRFGMATIGANPLAYLQLAASHYAMSWVLFTDDDPLPLYKAVVRYGVIMIGMATLLLAFTGVVLAARRTLPPCLRVPVLCSLLVHGSFLLIGLTGVYVSRYTSDYWPAMVLALLLPLCCLHALPPARGERPAC